MENTIIPFVRKSMEVNNTILAIFEQKLGLPEGELAKCHLTDKLCGSEARCIKNPPNQTTAGIGAHTDFGTLVRTTHVLSSPNFRCLKLVIVLCSQPPRRFASYATWISEVVLR